MRELSISKVASFTNHGVIGSVYKQQQNGITNLYRYSNGKTDRLSTSPELKDNSSMKRVGTLGFVYTTFVDDGKILYEVSNGTDFAYTTKNSDSYGEKGKWKRPHS